MPLVENSTLQAIARAAADFDKTNDPKAAAKLADLTRHALPGKTWRDFHRLLGFPEALTLDQEPGVAIHLYHELVAPYKKVPPLLEMHFRDLARLQLELYAWEGIRDAELQYRAEQGELEEQKRRFEQDREVSATAPNLFEKGLCRQPDSSGKFRNQSELLILLRDSLRLRQYDGLEDVLARLYGEDLAPDHERGVLICVNCRHLMKPKGDEPKDDDEFNTLLTLIEDEHRDVMKAWDIEIRSKRFTQAEKRTRLAATKEDHWMNRQGDRLRQAIDRKLRFTVTLLQVLGLAQKKQPTRLTKRGRKTSVARPKGRKRRRTTHRMRWMA